MLILFSFVGQAVSYQYRRKSGNIYGTRFYDWLLFINGCVGCFLLGVAVSMFFFGGPALHYFALALTIGILLGVYSSVFVSAAIALYLGVKREDLVKKVRKDEISDMVP